MAASKGAALVYCRVSTKGQEQDGTSLDSQEAACVAHAQAQGYTVDRITREVYSGSELWDRPLLARDRADLKFGKFAALVSYATDRLARDPIHLAIIADECARADVALIFVTEPLDSTPEGQLIQYVKGYAASIERAKIRERTLRGKHTRLLRGMLHSHAPELYGYRRDKDAGKREIYEPEAQVVRLIFAWVADEGLAIRSVARRLNEQGVPPPSAGKMTFDDPDRTPRWGKNQVQRLLHNPSYKGDTVVWRWARDPKKHVAAIRDEAEHIHLPEGVTPVIVSPDQWECAQAALTANHGDTTRNAVRPYLLRGHVWCAVCGQRMQSNVENRRTRIYRCSSRDTARGACGGKRAPADDIEAWAWEKIAAALRNPEVIAAERKRRQDEGSDPTLTRDLETARRKVAQCKSKQADMMRRYNPDDSRFPWELVEREVNRLEIEKQGWQRTIGELAERIARAQQAVGHLEDLYAYCARASAQLEHAGFNEKRTALLALDIRVTANGRDWAVSGIIPIPVTGDAAIGAVSPNISTLCPPLAATSIARLTCSCPRTSERS
jgi:site-specific DNA recombinase